MQDDQAQNLTRSVTFGRVLRELRLAKGLSQEALAELARMSSGGVGVLERGVRRAPQRETLQLLATALNLSPAEREQFESAARRAGNGRRRRGRSPTNSAAPRHNLPFALTSFVGRAHAVASLRTQFIEHRLVTLTGAGGVGKTRLALETAHIVLDAFPDGVWLVELAPLADADLVAQRIAETLGVAAHSEPTMSDAWMEQLVGKHQLLILDNCEHLLLACATISKRLLERCPQMHILVTSREPLHLTGERIVRIDSLRESAAIELFLDRAKDVSWEFTIRDDDREALQHVRTICTQLDGIPFAIELAAARVPALPLKILANNINQRLRLLRTGMRATVPRHATMRALIDWSYDLLSEAERRIFEDLSIFGGSCALDAAITVCGGEIAETDDVLEILTSLVEKSLVVVDFDRSEPRYGLLGMSREYAREKLLARPDFEHVAQRHALAYQALAQRLDDKWSTSADRAWYAQAGSELENWRVAIHWALGDQHDVLLGLRLVGALQPVWITFALSEGRHWCRAALERVDDTTPRDVVAKLEYAASIIAFLAGEFTVALGAGERARAAYRALGDGFGTARAQLTVGNSLIYSGKSSEGEALLWDALEIARRIDNPLLVTYVQLALGASRGVAGDHEVARDHFTEALAIAESVGAERAALIAAMNSAEAHFHLGDANTAVELASKALDASRILGDEYSKVYLLKSLAKYLLTSARYDEARTAAQESLELSRHAGGTAVTAWTLQHLAMVAALRPRDGERAAADDRVRAARILGYSEARLAALGDLGDFAEQAERGRLKAVLADALGPSELARLVSMGATMSEAEVLDEAMAI